MFDKIYSKVEPDKLLHIVCRPTELNNSRNDIVDQEQYLQLAILNFNIWWPQLLNIRRRNTGSGIQNGSLLWSI